MNSWFVDFGADFLTRSVNRSALRSIRRWQRRIQMVEHLVRRGRGGVEASLRGGLDLIVALSQQFFFMRLVPGAGIGQVVTQAQHRLALPRRGDFFGRT